MILVKKIVWSHVMTETSRCTFRNTVPGSKLTVYVRVVLLPEVNAVSLLTNPQYVSQEIILELQRMAGVLACLDFCFFSIDLPWCWSVLVVRTSGR